MASSPKVPLTTMETKEQTSTQELLESSLQIQKSPEPEVMSTQEDMFDQSNKTASDACSTPSREEGGCSLASTPATTLHLLQLSGQRSLVQESLSTNSSDLVAPSPDALRSTPFIVPSSPTEQEGRTGKSSFDTHFRLGMKFMSCICTIPLCLDRDVNC
ncbi:TP53-binding protein 1-like [Erinaceus europaeus]|uniref:TP53-binding protein 1-like n=1 Tax=Erinaceus europaeus TaxID=9365 RepID=A0ABM3WUG6_ERIEU|nr:TP53-binding protein 1-like [Erinaceus europaeus]